MKKVLIPTLLLSLFFSASAFADDIKDKYPSLNAPKYSLSADKIARLDEPWRVSEFNQRFLDPAVSHYDFIETLDDFETTQGKTVKTNTSKAYTLTVKPNKYGFPLGNSVVIIGVRKFDYSTEKISFNFTIFMKMANIQLKHNSSDQVQCSTIRLKLPMYIGLKIFLILKLSSIFRLSNSTTHPGQSLNVFPNFIWRGKRLIKRG